MELFPAQWACCSGTGPFSARNQGCRKPTPSCVIYTDLNLALPELYLCQFTEVSNITDCSHSLTLVYSFCKDICCASEQVRIPLTIDYYSHPVWINLSLFILNWRELSRHRKVERTYQFFPVQSSSIAFPLPIAAMNHAKKKSELTCSAFKYLQCTYSVLST